MGAGSSPWILGVNAYDHDVSACLLRDGEVVVAIAKERLTGVKHDQGFYDEVLAYCLNTAGIGLDDLDLVVSNSYMLPVPEFELRLLHEHRPVHLSLAERKRALASPLFLSRGPRHAVCSHHLAHAYSAFALSPFEEGAVMVVDGVGSYRRDVVEAVPASDEAHPLARESESWYRFEGTRLETLKKVWMGPGPGLFSDEFFVMDGLGALYSRVSTYVFGDWNHCGEVMGLAPYGRLLAKPLAELRGDDLVVRPWGEDRRHPFLGGGDEAWGKSPHRPEWEDLCRQVQEDTERILVERARALHAKTGTKNLCLAGGVALNCVANGKILEETPFERIFVQPAAGDDGIAIGCACHGHLALRGGKRTSVMESAYLGRPPREAEVGDAVAPFLVRAATTRRRPRDLAEATAALLERGKVVGWFQGGSEFGPRALGHRSILADPRDAAMKDRVNARVKLRQSFRPFAPVVLAERAGEYFEGDAESPFMLLARRVRPEARSKIPAVVHVDGTARVQTLRRETNPRLYALLEAFERRTGVPVLLNTSFNLRGDPIVENPTDAVACLLYSRLDALVLEDHLLEERHLHRLLWPLFHAVARTRHNLRATRLLEVVAQGVLDGPDG
ncbi:MAG: carbamoyltransferase [Planctomycetota bacterium]